MTAISQLWDSITFTYFVIYKYHLKKERDQMCRFGAYVAVVSDLVIFKEANMTG